MSYSQTTADHPAIRRKLMNSTAILCGIMMIFGQAASAQDALTWDSDPDTFGIQIGNGDWNTSDNNWQDQASPDFDSAVNNDANTTFSSDDADTVTFGGLSGGATANVGLEVDVRPGAITFDTDGYEISDTAGDGDQIVVEDGDALPIDVVSGTATVSAGISNKGTITINGDPGSAGTLVLSGTSVDDGTQDEGDYVLERGGLTVSGSTAAEDDIEVNGGTLTVTGTVGGDVQQDAGQFTNTGSVGGTVTVTTAGAIFDNDAGGVTGLTTLTDGTINAGGGAFTGGVQVDGGEFNVEADTTVAMTQAGGTVNVDDGVTLTSDLDVEDGINNNNGTIDGNVTITGGQLNNGEADGDPTGIIDGDVLVNGGTLVNNGDAGLAGVSDITGTVQIGTDDADNAGGIVDADGGTFADIDIFDGTLNINESTTADTVDNDGGTVAIDPGVTLTTDFDQTDGGTTIGAGATLDDTDGTANVSGGTVENAGTIDDALAISGTGDVRNNTGGAISGDVTIAGDGILQANGGTLGGDVAVNGGNFNVNASVTVTDTIVNDGTVDVAGGQTLTTDLTQAGGTTTINATGTLDDTDGTIAVLGGSLVNEGIVQDDVVITGDGTLVAGGGTFNDGVADQNVTVNDDGTFDIDAATTVATTTVNGGDVDIGSGATLTTELVQTGGTVTVNGGATLDDTTDAITVDGGRLTNAGTVIDEVTVEAGGTVEVAGGTFTNGLNANGGDVEITADSTLDLDNMGSDIAIDPGIELTGDVTNQAGNIESAGNITGTLSVTDGNFTQLATTPAGSGVDGAVTVDGATASLNATGGTFDAGMTALNDGQIIVDGEATGDITNDGGTVSITGTGDLDGNLTNTTGTSSIADGGQLDGDLTVNGGDVDSDGTITGTATVADGTFTTTTNSDVQGVASVTGGTLQADGGNFGAGITATDGEVNIGGDVTGDVSIADAELLIESGGDLEGDVTYAGVGAQGRNEGQLDGDLTVTSGTFTNTGDITAGNTVTVAGAAAGGPEFVLDDGDVAAEIVVNAGTFTANGGTFSGGATANAPTVDTTSAIVIAGSSTGDVTNNGGTVDVETTATLTGDIDSVAGQTTIDGTVTGEVASTGATADTDVNGTVGSLDVSDGVVTTVTGSTVTGGTTVSGGTLEANGGTFTGGIVATGGIATVGGTIAMGAGEELIADDGDVTIAAAGTVNGDVASINSGGAETGTLTNAGTVNGDARVDGNTFNNTNVVTGEVTVTGGTVNNTGTVQGGMDVSGGDANNAGLVEGGVDVSGTGDFTLQAGGTITDASTVAGGGEFIVEGGTFTDGVTNNGGTIDVTASATGNITNTDGLAEIDAAAILTGDIDNGADGDLIIAGTLGGDLENDGGQVDAAGTVTGTTLNTGGGAALNVDVAAAFDGVVTNQSGATINIDGGTLTGDVDNLAGGTVALAGGTLTGVFDNDADAEISGAAAIIGATTNSGNFDIAAGDSLAITGGLTNESGGMLGIADGAMLSATDTLINDSGGELDLDGTIATAFANTGEVDVTGDADQFGGLVTNGTGGRIFLNDDGGDVLRFGGGLNGGGGVVDTTTRSGGVGDSIEITGDLTGTNRFALDIDLSDDSDTATPPGTDVVVATGEVGGTLVFDLNLLGSNGQQADDLRIFDSSGDASYTFQVFGLPDASEAIVYTPDRIGSGPNEGDIFIVDSLNPGVAGLTGSIVLAQSLIGSVVNRPSSPFVSGLAYDDPNPCGVGGWVRGIAGQADANGEVTEVENNTTLDWDISVDYTGLQLGGDLACFNGYFDGWDISFGGIGGFNEGTTTQDVFALEGDGSGGITLGDERTSVTTVDFGQRYGGVYLTGAFDRFSADLQYRVEETDYVANNVGVGGLSGLGLTDSEFSSETTTFSGQVSYAIPFGESNIAFVPTAGFAYSDVSTGIVNFEDGGTVALNDFTSETIFAGGTLSRTVFGDDGVSATNQFGTITFYNDFADSPTGLYTPPEGSALEQRNIIGENLGGYAELSAGLNYLRILPVDAPLGAKQFSTSIRGDLRASDQLSSWGFTSQIRIQF
ncbi:beta strand repeat-containing protein [Yoonia sp. 2307UL14-13]|uniref:beta strand repeat-containing protein n=1 Tax=Yoonia sp. 2307UL14-13 TaxID=3126506 RepID=UPI0030B3EC64